jgi:hypothetical protein
MKFILSSIWKIKPVIKAIKIEDNKIKSAFISKKIKSIIVIGIFAQGLARRKATTE